MQVVDKTYTLSTDKKLCKIMKFLQRLQYKIMFYQIKSNYTFKF